MDLNGTEAAMYLRKSRAEDGMDTAEILRRHRETLTEYAAREGIRVTETFQEIKSGESLYARPEMGRLLEAVEAGRFGAILCMDIDRLSRGETRERGMIWSVFKETGTLIVTPGKTYDLSEESDELMTELRGLFAHFELNKIKERTKRGMIRAAKEGCHLSYAPYGYRKRVIDKKHTLEAYEPEARFVRLAFELYASGVGCGVIAERLTEAGARPRRGTAFSDVTILKMIKNPVYIGKIVYNREQWTRKNGNLKIRIRPEAEWVVTDGLHPAIVDAELFEKCQCVLKERWRPAYFDGIVKTSLIGLIRCRNCGGRMQKRTIDGRYYLYCRTRGCCTASRYENVENAVITGLEEMLSEWETEPGAAASTALEAAEARLKSVGAALSAETAKKALLFDFLEDGTYTKEDFRERMNKLNGVIAALERETAEAKKAVDALSNTDAERQAAGIRTLLSEYWDADAPRRNELLRGVVDVIWYDKPKGSADFDIEIFLR